MGTILFPYIINGSIQYSWWFLNRTFLLFLFQVPFVCLFVCFLVSVSYSVEQWRINSRLHQVQVDRWRVSNTLNTFSNLHIVAVHFTQHYTLCAVVIVTAPSRVNYSFLRGLGNMHRRRLTANILVERIFALQPPLTMVTVDQEGELPQTK